MTLAEYFAIGMARQLKHELFPGFSPRAIQQLMDHNWPGNIRELKNVVERSVYRNPDIEAPITNIVVDPFASPYRPTTRVKTRERQHQASNQVPLASPDTAPSGSSEPSNNKINFPIDFKEHCEGLEVTLLKQALEAGQFNQKKTAELLNLSYHQLRGILKK